MNKVQKSSSFILPILGISISKLYNNGLLNSYLGSVEYTGSSDWGELIFLEFNTSKLSSTFLSELRNSEHYNDEYDPTSNTVHIVFRIPEKYLETVVQPFLEGKYSKIDRNYVKQYFPPMVLTDSGGYLPSMNYKILTKDQGVANYWREFRGLDIPEDAEVWSRPEKEDEIYGYKESLIENTTQRSSVEVG